jgi:hypothetical protein
MSALPGCIIRDVYAALQPSGVMGGQAGMITARASLSPLFVKQADGSWTEQASLAVRTSTLDGSWTLVLPAASNSDPASAHWTITLPDGTSWNGTINDSMVSASATTPLTLHDLESVYGWALVNSSPLASLATFVATTTALGMVTLDQNPSSGNPIVLTAPRRGAANGMCDLDSAVHVPLSRLAGLTTSNLSATAGILAGQITSVNPSALTGSGTVPQAGLPANVAYVDAANTFTVGPNVFRPSAAASVGLQIKGLASQTADLQQWQSSTGTVLAKLDAAGAFYLTQGLASLSTLLILSASGGEFLRGGGTSASLHVPLIPLTGAAETPLIVKGAASQSADLQQWQSSAGTALAAINSAGQLKIGGGSYNAAYTVDCPSGQATFGSVSLGVGAGVKIWHGGSNARMLNLGGPAGQEVQLGSSGGLGFLVNGATSVMNLSTAGVLSVVSTPPASANGGLVNLGSGAFDGVAAGHFVGSASGTQLAINAASGYTGNLIDAQLAGVSKFKVDNGGALTCGAITGGNVSLGSATFSGAIISLTSLTANPNVAGVVPLVAKGTASQTADLQQWQDSAATVLAKVDSSGNVLATGKSVNVGTAGSFVGNTITDANGLGPYLTLSQTALTVNVRNLAHIGFTVKGAASQSGDLQQWQNNAGTVLANVDFQGFMHTGALGAYGVTTGGYLSFSTNNSTIANTLSAAVTPLVAKGFASQSADLQQWQDSTAAVLAKIDSGGNLTAKLASFSGAQGANVITLTDTTASAAAQMYFTAPLGSAPDLNINANRIIFPSANGILCAGISFLGTTQGALVLNATNHTANLTPTGGHYSFVGTSNTTPSAYKFGVFCQTAGGETARIGIVVQAAASATADLQQWQNSAGTVLAKIDASGAYTGAVTGTGGVQVFTGSAAPGTGSTAYTALTLQNTSANNSKVQIVVGGTAATHQWSIGNDINGANVQNFYIYDAARNASPFFIDGSGNFVLGYTSIAPTAGATLDVRGSAAGTVGATIKGAASQTADLQQWQNNSGTVLARVNSLGYFSTDATGSSTAAPATLGIVNAGAGNAARIFLGDTSNAIQSATSLSPSIQTYYGLQIYGNRQTTPSNTYTLTNDTCLIVYAQHAADKGVVVQGAASQTADLQQWQNSAGTALSKVDAGGGLTVTQGARITSGSGAPTTPGGANPTAGDVYHRTDTPSTANQRLYVCTVGGASPTWVGIV